MKVYIGKPPSRVITKLYDWHMERKYGADYRYNVDQPIEDNFDKIVDKCDDFFQSIANWTINLYLDRKKTKQKIRIDPWDSWCVGTTLSPIIVPMLQQLQTSKHGAPFVDIEDVPENLRSTEKDEHGLDKLHFERWDWVLEEMIWAFQQKCGDDDLLDKFWDEAKNELDREGFDVAHARMTNGFRLFGKYFENLWD